MLTGNLREPVQRDDSSEKFRRGAWKTLESEVRMEPKTNCEGSELELRDLATDQGENLPLA
jgi:hypothetical protein